MKQLPLDKKGKLALLIGLAGVLAIILVNRPQPRTSLEVVRDLPQAIVSGELPDGMSIYQGNQPLSKEVATALFRDITRSAVPGWTVLSVHSERKGDRVSIVNAQMKDPTGAVRQFADSLQEADEGGAIQLGPFLTALWTLPYRQEKWEQLAPANRSLAELEGLKRDEPILRKHGIDSISFGGTLVPIPVYRAQLEKSLAEAGPRR